MRTIPTIIVAGAVLLSACGGDSDDSSAGPGAVAAEAADGSGDPQAPAGAPTDGGGAGPTALPDDACTLLTADEVAQVAPGATPSGDVATAAGLTTASCTWDNPTHQVALTLNTGLPVEQLENTVEIEVRDYGGEFVDVGGEQAGVWSVLPISISLKLTRGDVLMSLDINGEGASESQDALVALAGAVVGRLP